MSYSLSMGEETIPEQITSYMQDLGPLLEFPETPEVIGHRIGDFQHYPTNVNKKKYLKKYKDIIPMMDFAFLNSGLSGIELDIRLWGMDRVSVVHDKAKKDLSEESIQYLERNALELVLKHFIEQGYYKNRKIYIELKLSGKLFHPGSRSFLPDIVSKYEKNLIEKLAECLESVVQEHPDSAEIRKSIGFISFSLAALHYAYTIFGLHHKLYLITTTDQFMKKSISRAMFYVPLTEQTRLKICYSEWLTGIWFDPYYLDEPVETFLLMNENRKNPLEFYLSTYGMKKKKLIKKFKDKKRLPVRGVIFELELLS